MYTGRRTKSGVIALGIYVISYFIFCVWETRRVFRYKKMRMRMTKRINVIIKERRVSNRRGLRSRFRFRVFQDMDISLPGWMNMRGLPSMDGCFV